MPIIRINDDTAERLRALAQPSENTADDIVRRLAGLEPVERKVGWAKGRPRGPKWPFATMAVGDHVDYPRNQEGSRVMAAALKRAKAGNNKTFHSYAVEGQGYRVERVA